MKRVSKKEDDLIREVPAIRRIGIVAVQPPPIIVRIEIEHVRVAVRAGICAFTRLDHCPLNTLRAVSYSPSEMA